MNNIMIGNKKPIERINHNPSTLIKWKYICPICGNLKLNIEVEEVICSTFAITPAGGEGKCVKINKPGGDCNYILSCKKCGSWVNFNDIHDFPLWKNEWYGKTVEDIKNYEEKLKELREEWFNDR